MPHSATLTLNRRRQIQVVDERSCNTWKTVTEKMRVPAAEVAIGTGPSAPPGVSAKWRRA